MPNCKYDPIILTIICSIFGFHSMQFTFLIRVHRTIFGDAKKSLYRLNSGCKGSSFTISIS